LSGSEQLTHPRSEMADSTVMGEGGVKAPERHSEAAASELAAKRSLKAQIARLDRELCSLVIGGFPHIGAAPAGPPAGRAARPAGRAGRGRIRSRSGGAWNDGRVPRLLSLEELERERDALVGRLREAEVATAARTEHERRARELLDGMLLEPGRYKFVKLRAADVGEAGCGVWHVRPRLGLIGMLAGWWQVKLSSGCPLPRGRATGAALLKTVRAAGRPERGPQTGAALRRFRRARSCASASP
jgi:hypothetical protein